MSERSRISVAIASVLTWPFNAPRELSARARRATGNTGRRALSPSRLATASLPPGAPYILAVVLDKGFSILTIPLMAHRLSPAEFGRLDVAVSAVEFIGLFMTLGLAETCLRYAQLASQDEDARRRMAAAIFGAGIILAICLGVGVQLFLPAIAGAIGVAVDPFALRIAAAAACATALIELPLVWLRLHRRAWLFLGFVGGRASVQAALTVAVLLAGWGADGLLISNGCLALLFAACLGVFQLRQTGIAFDAEALAPIARYGLPLVGGLLSMFALGNCDRWFLAHRASPAEIAYYGLAVKLGLVTAVFYQPFLLWWSARRLAILRENGPRALAAEWMQGVGLLLASALLVALAAPMFIHAAFPTAYSKAISYLPYLVLISVLNELCSLSNTGVYASDHGFRVLAVNVAGAAVAVAGYAILIPSDGIMGAIEATIAAHLTRLILFLWLGHEKAPAQYAWGRAGFSAAVVIACVAGAPAASNAMLRGGWLIGSSLILVTALAGLRMVIVPEALGRRLERLIPGSTPRHGPAKH